MRIAILVGAIASIIISTAFAANFKVEGPFPSGQGPYFNISMTGDIKATDVDDFKRLTRNIERAVVFLGSPGGSVRSGIAIGEHIRARKYATVMNDHSICLSICPIIWLGGVGRYIYASSKIGFHAAYYKDENGSVVPSATANAIIGAYLGKLGYGYEFIEVVTSTPPEEMFWLDAKVMKRLGVSFFLADEL